MVATFPSLAVCKSRNSVGQQEGMIWVGCFSGGGREYLQASFSWKRWGSAGVRASNTVYPYEKYGAWTRIMKIGLNVWPHWGQWPNFHSRHRGQGFTEPFEQMALFHNNCMCGIGFCFVTIFAQPALSSLLSIVVLLACFQSEWELLGTCLRRPKTDPSNFMYAWCATSYCCKIISQRSLLLVATIFIRQSNFSTKCTGEDEETTAVWFMGTTALWVLIHIWISVL